MSKVMGTPIYIFNADDPSKSKAGDKGKTETTSSRLQEALKAIKPLESAEAGLNKALESLDGTGYDEIRDGISACLQNLKAAANKVLGQLQDGVAPQGQPQQPASQGPQVPTAGQIAGREPLAEAFPKGTTGMPGGQGDMVRGQGFDRK